MHKPNFLCVGAQKSGTSSLYGILKQHSEIFMPNKKELHFFDLNKNFAKGKDRYFEMFQNSGGYLAKGEITPNYIYDEFVPKRILDILGEDIKLIFILRNPASRAFSHYKMRLGRKFEKKTFKNAVKLEINELNKEIYELEHKYISRGFYNVQIKRYLELFDQKNMLFIHFEEDFIQNREQTIKNVFKFLQVNENEKIGINVKSTPGVASKSKKANEILNSAHPINQFAKKLIPNKKVRTNIKYFFTKINQKPTADKAELEEMRPFLINEIYKDSILELEKLIGRDLSSWLKI